MRTCAVLDFERLLLLSDMNKMPSEALILAGGLGTRLRGIVKDSPKPMAEIAGRPFLEWLIIQVRSQNVRKVILCVGYLGEVVQRHFGDGRQWGVSIDYSIENSPLGTGGGLRLAANRISENPVLAMNGDSYCRFDLEKLMHEHKTRGARTTLVLVEVADRSRFGSIALGKDGSIATFHEKSPEACSGLVNAGIYLMETETIQSITPSRPVSLENDVLPGLVGRGLFGTVSRGPFVDIGTPSSFAGASEIILREYSGY
jgi:NDP-sugar pyrophosphorylase family protein